MTPMRLIYLTSVGYLYDDHQYIVTSENDAWKLTENLR